MLDMFRHSYLLHSCSDTPEPSSWAISKSMFIKAKFQATKFTKVIPSGSAAPKFYASGRNSIILLRNARHFRGAPLESLKLRGNAIGDAGAKALGSALADGAALQDLDVASNQVPCKSDMSEK